VAPGNSPRQFPQPVLQAENEEPADQHESDYSDNPNEIHSLLLPA
jgi:hypothetical protein